MEDFKFVDENFKSECKKITKLGEGTFGKVSLYSTPTGNYVIKKTKINHESLGYPPDLLKEIDMLVKFKSLRNVIQIKGAFLHPTESRGYILLEPLDTNLDKWIEQTKFSERIKYLTKLIVEIGEVLAIMHKYFLIHNDIKPDNILIKMTDEGPIFKLADFGKSKRILDPKYHMEVVKNINPLFIIVFIIQNIGLF